MKITIALWRPRVGRSRKKKKKFIVYRLIIDFALLQNFKLNAFVKHFCIFSREKPLKHAMSSNMFETIKVSFSISKMANYLFLPIKLKSIEYRPTVGKLRPADLSFAALPAKQ